MPAVDPTRLRFQIDALINVFDSPEIFHRRLSDLFSMYANRTLRFGDTAAAQPLIPIYHLPHPVFRQLKLDLLPIIRQQPDAALEMADELWNDPYFEVKQTAIFILGSVPVDQPDPILERLQSWLSPGLERRLAADLFSTGTAALQESFPQSWERFINHTLDQQDPKWVAKGILGLTEGLKNTEFKNLPAIFRLVSRFIRDPQEAVMRDLENLVTTLAKRSPTETAFYLKQNYSVSDSPLTGKLIKQCLPAFPEKIQQDLKTTIRK